MSRSYHSDEPAARVPPISTGAEYDALAPHYDAFTDDPRYAGWIRHLEALARRHGLTGRRARCRKAARLGPGGVLLFDVNTLATYASFFARTHARETGT